VASSRSPTTAEESVRPLGRPRAAGGVPAGPPTDEIIAAAGRLFAQRGDAKVTMSDIARAAGLQQSSLITGSTRSSPRQRIDMALKLRRPMAEI
jgi:hypothetical protein